MTSGKETQIEHLLTIGRYDDAYPLIGELLSSEPENGYLYFQLTRVYLGQGDYKKAEETCHTGIHCEPEEAFGYYLLSFISRYLKKFDKELQAAESAIQIESEHPDYIQRYAEACLSSGMVKKAQSACQQLLAIHPDSESAYELMGDIYFYQDKFTQAEESYRQALTFSPDSLVLQNDLARSLIGQKKWREAAEVLHNSVKLDPSNESIQDNLLMCIQEMIGTLSGQGINTKKLQEIPQDLQMFYQEKMKQRQKSGWHPIYIVLLWISGLFILMLLFQSAV